ncbi:hypothetical protein N665_0454s0009 [Sinapis alba]|nr:hypothetical protein N665_3187s0017 [Sinapis alba]KAF8091068.1 hypothetical protein N665_0454s0009 [Sinapis alba]
MRHGTEPLRRSYGGYEGNFESNLPLFLSSSVVERSAVN